MAIPPVIVLLVSLNIFVGYKSKQSKLHGRIQSIQSLKLLLQTSSNDRNVKLNDTTTSSTMSPSHIDDGFYEIHNIVHQPMKLPEEQENGTLRSSLILASNCRSASQSEINAKQNLLLSAFADNQYVSNLNEVAHEQQQQRTTSKCLNSSSFRSSDSESRRSLSTSLRNSLSLVVSI